MPELPEVETIKKAVEKGIGKAEILNIEIKNRQLRETKKRPETRRR